MDALAQLIGGWMARQRWYAGKGGVPLLRTVGELSLDSADRDARIRVLLLADDADSRGCVYQVPIVERHSVPAGLEPHLIGAHEDQAIFDAPHDPAYAAALLGAIRGPATGAAEQITGSSVLNGEQSNTSIVVSTRAAGGVIVKVFRVVHVGNNPDAEITAALNTAGVGCIPRYLGSLDAEWSDASARVGTGHLAIAQEFIPGASDAWTVARRAVDAGVDFSTEAFQLGAATVVLHTELASCLSTRAPDTDLVAAITSNWRARLDIAIHDVPSLETHRATIDAAYVAAELSDWPPLQRIHGDLHLGQILDASVGTGARWLFIDFEGEPLRSLEERVRPEPPLRDVAGMLRSFDYAGASSDHPDADAWVRRASDAYVAGYESSGSIGGDHALLTAFELDKAVYEASYEARNRPTWLPIPLRAIDRLTNRRLA